jgi:hypothetical protein
MVDSFVGGICGCSMLGAHFTESMEEFVVHRLCIV